MESLMVMRTWRRKVRNMWQCVEIVEGSEEQVTLVN